MTTVNVNENNVTVTIQPGTGTSSTAAAISTHNSDTTSVHGIADTSALETTTGSAAKVSDHNSLAAAHGVASGFWAAAAGAAAPGAGNLVMTDSAVDLLIETPAAVAALVNAERAANNAYTQTFARKAASTLLGSWNLNDLWNNTIALDANGLYNGAHFKTSIGLGAGSAYFNGFNSKADLYSAALASAFNGAAGSIILWFKQLSSSYAAAAVGPRLAYIYVNDNNQVLIQKLTTSNLFYCSYKAGGTDSAGFITTASTDWVQVAITWDKAADEVKIYLNGAQSGTTKTGLGTWSGTPSLMQIGFGNAGEAWWHGWLQHVELHNAALTAADITARYNSFRSITMPTFAHFVAFGDSITYGTGSTGYYGWAEKMRDWLLSHRNGLTLLDNWGGSGYKATNIDTTSTAWAAYGTADIIAVMIGMNDYTGQTALATFNAQLTSTVARLKAKCNQLLLVNIPPTTAVGVITRAQYNAEIATVATAQSVTLVDVSSAYNTGTHTTDGTHPNDAGAAVLAGLIEAAVV